MEFDTGQAILTVVVGVVVAIILSIIVGAIFGIGAAFTSNVFG
jgi:Na+/citrate or Na+/malate symporter